MTLSPVPVPVPVGLASALRARSGVLVAHAGAVPAVDVLPVLLGPRTDLVSSSTLAAGRLRIASLALLAIRARRTGMPAVLVVHLAGGPDFAADARLLTWARTFGLHAVAHLVDAGLERMLLRADCPVTDAALRADVVLTADGHDAAIVHALLEGAPHAVAVVPLN